MIVGPDGALYFTDPTLDLVAGEKQEIPFQGVYRLDDKGNVRLADQRSDATERTGLFSGWQEASTSTIARKETFASTTSPPTERSATAASSARSLEQSTMAFPTASRWIRKATLFVTGPKGIWVWDAKGNHLGTIVMPEQPANLTWGDKEYRTLYITATTSVYRLEIKTPGFVPYLQH